MTSPPNPPRPPYRRSLAGRLLNARELVMAPLRPLLRQAGFTEQQWRVMRVLVDEGDTDPSGLAEAALLHAPSVTRILKELSDRGLISREIDPKDGRRSILKATAKGRDLVERTARKTSAVLQSYTQRFGPERLAALQGELAEFVKLIGESRARGED